MKHLGALCDHVEAELSRLFEAFDPVVFGDVVAPPPGPIAFVGPRIYLCARLAYRGRSETVVSEITEFGDPMAWRHEFRGACRRAAAALAGAPRPEPLGKRLAAW